MVLQLLEINYCAGSYQSQLFSRLPNAPAIIDVTSAFASLKDFMSIE